jgi:hypothetical protein
MSKRIPAAVTVGSTAIVRSAASVGLATKGGGPHAVSSR